jgi:hypothetical protein
MNIKFNLQPKVTGIGTFTPPKGWRRKVDGKWIKIDIEEPKTSDDNSSDISEASEDQQ